MRVYITFAADGFGDNEIDKVFSSSEKACEHVIEKYFRRNHYYRKFNEDELKKEALFFIVESEVEVEKRD